MPTDDARERDTDRATRFATRGTTADPDTGDSRGEPGETPDGTAGETPERASEEAEPEGDGRRDGDDINTKNIDTDSGHARDTEAPGAGTGGVDDAEPGDTPAGDPAEPDDRYDAGDMPDTGPEEVYTPGEMPGTGAGNEMDDAIAEPETGGAPGSAGGPEEDADMDEDVPQSSPLTAFEPGSGTDPIGDIDGGTEGADATGVSLDAVEAAQDDYRDVLAGAAEDILTGTSPFEGWQFVAGRAADAAEDYVAVLEEALPADIEHDAAAAGATADEAAGLFGVGTYNPDDFTPVDLGIARESVFGRIVYAFQQEFSSGGGMETLFDREEDGDVVLDTLSTKLTNYVNWANGGHGEPVDAERLADLYRAAKDEDGLRKVADAAWNRGTLRGEVRSQAYVDKSESMEKLASFTVQTVETGLTELDAHVATTDYRDSWIMSEEAEIETYVAAAVDAVKDGFKTVMTAARLWNQQEQELSKDPETKQRYDDAAAFFPGSNHAQQNRDAFYTLAEEGVAMMAAGRDALDSGLLDTIDAELGQWEQVFEEQEVGALLDLTEQDYGALEDAHDAYTAAKDGLEGVAGTLDGVLSYTDQDELDGAVDAIDAATGYLADLGTDVVAEMTRNDGVQDGRYGHAAVGEAMKDSYLPSYTPQEDDERRDDLNTALRTFAGYVS